MMVTKRILATIAVVWLALAAYPAVAWQISNQAAPAAIYACPMHPDATSNSPGKCPRCGMTLVLMDPFDAREYLVDVSTEPKAIRAREPFKLQLFEHSNYGGAERA